MKKEIRYIDATFMVEGKMELINRRQPEPEEPVEEVTEETTEE